MTARVLPTAADVLRVLAVALTRPLEEGERRDDAFAVALCSVTERRQIAEVAAVLRAIADRVAPIGSVPPEVYARDVEEAYREAWAPECCGNMPSAEFVGRQFAASEARADLLTTLAAHGLTPDEAARVVAGVDPEQAKIDEVVRQAIEDFTASIERGGR